MKTITGLIFLLLLSVSGSVQARVINAASVSRSDVAAAIHSAVNGDTVVIPAGASTWTTGISVSRKAIKIQGAGSGRIIGRTLTSNTVGTGSKTFTTQSGLSISLGQTLRIIRRVIQSDAGTNVRGTFMEGTVTSYSGTSLVMNITSTGGSGTFAAWLIATVPQTTIAYTGATSAAFTLTSNGNGNLELSGIKFASNHALPAYQILILYGTSNTLIHDCWFELSLGGAVSINFNTNRTLIWNCSFESSFFQSEIGLQFKWEGGNGPLSWTTADTLGTHDTDGNHNVYIEDCDFHLFLNALDFDGNSRVVVRHCTFNNTGTGSHGADTGPYGTRHWELYDNTFIFEPTTNGIVLPVQWWYFCRGGTGIITDNVMPRLISQDWGHKNAVRMIVENIRRSGTPGPYPIGPYPCWTTYPVPHSPGQGNDGSSNIMLAGDFTDPIRIWNNTGPVDSSDVAVAQYDPDECGNNEQATDFTQINRDYFFSTDATAARPGYVKYTYPHPLRGDPTPSPTPTPTPTSTPAPTPRPAKKGHPH